MSLSSVTTVVKNLVFRTGIRLALLALDVRRQIVLDPNDFYVPSFGGTWLHAAIHFEDTAVLPRIIEKGARVDTEDKYGRDALEYAVFKGVDAAVHSLCLAHCLENYSAKRKNDILDLALINCSESALHNLRSFLGWLPTSKTNFFLDDKFLCRTVLVTTNLFAHNANEPSYLVGTSCVVQLPICQNTNHFVFRTNLDSLNNRSVIGQFHYRQCGHFPYFSTFKFNEILKNFK